jgi:hypothetical protein
VTAKNERPADGEQHRHESDSLNRLRAQLETESGDSRKLLKNLKDNPICSLTFDEAIPAVVIIWRQYATSTQLRFIHESILGLLQKHAASKILGDDTDLPTIPAEDQAWIVEDWMPRAIVAGLKFACCKRPDSYFGRVSVRSVQSVAPKGLATREFDNFDEARRWLKSACPS